MKKLMKVLTIAVCLAMLFTAFPVFAETESGNSETVWVYDMANSYQVVKNSSEDSVKKIDTISDGNINVKTTSAIAHRTAYLKFNLNADSIKRIKTADKLNLEIYGYATNADAEYEVYKVEAWGGAIDSSSVWSIGETVGSQKIAVVNTPTKMIIDITKLINGINENDTNIRLAVRAMNTGNNGIIYSGNKNKDNCPKLVAEYTSTQPATFRFKKTAGLNPVNVVAIKENDPTVDHTKDTAADDSFEIFNSSSEKGYVFAKFDLTGIDVTKINTAVLTAKGYANGGMGMNLYAVTQSWNSQNGKYEKAESPAATVATASGDRDFNFDVLNYLKSLTGNVTEVEFMISINNTTSPKPYFIYIRNNRNIALNIDYGAEEVTSVSSIKGNGAITVTKSVLAGSAEASVTAVPILAAYSSDRLEAVSIGDAVTLSGTLTPVTQTLDISETGEAITRVSLFLWSSLTELVPITEADSLE